MDTGDHSYNGDCTCSWCLSEAVRLMRLRNLKKDVEFYKEESERYRLALIKILAKSKDNYIAAIADEALEPKIVVFSDETNKT